MNDVRILKYLFANTSSKVITTRLDILSLYKLCEITNRSNDFIMICNRIMRKVILDRSLEKFITLENSNNDIGIYTNGILAFFDILRVYFSEECIRNIWKYMKELDAIKGTQNEFEHIFEKYTTEQLKIIIHKYNNYNSNDNMKLLATIAKSEIEKRKNIYKK